MQPGVIYDVRQCAGVILPEGNLLDCEDKESLREGLKTVLPIIRKLAQEFADVYIPLDQLFEEALKTQPEPKFYSADGVHPNANGAQFIGTVYAEYVGKLVKHSL